MAMLDNPSEEINNMFEYTEHENTKTLSFTPTDIIVFLDTLSQNLEFDVLDGRICMFSTYLDQFKISSEDRLIVGRRDLSITYNDELIDRYKLPDWAHNFQIQFFSDNKPFMSVAEIKQLIIEFSEERNEE